MDLYDTFKSFIERFHAECIGVAPDEIVGVRLQIGSDELQEHLRRRADWHQRRSKWCAQQAEEMERGIGSNKGMTGDPAETMRERARQEADDAAKFEALARWLIPGKTFRLTESDMRRLELDKREE